MSRLPLAVAIVLAAALAGGCSKDPQKQGREFVASGDRYTADKKFKEAVLEYRNAVQADPKSGEARLKLANAYLQVQDAPNAYRETIRAADLLPDNVDAQLKAASFLMLAKKYEDARARAQNALNKDPRNVQAQILLGNATAGMKDFDAAVSEMEEAIRLDPARANTYANLGELELARGKKEAAEAAFKKAVEIDPKSVPARLALANYYAASDQRPLAEQTLKDALVIEPKNVLANRGLALLAIAGGRGAEAEPYLKIMAAASDQPSMKLSVADYYLAMGRKDEAARLLEELAGNADMYVPAKIRLATLAAAQNERPRANQIVDEVLVRDAKSGSALELKSRLLLADGKRDEALEKAKAAVAAEPGLVPAQYTLGLTYLAAGDADQARKAFEETLKLNPRAAAAQMQLARIQLASGKADSSGQYAQDVLKANPQHASARLVLVRSLIARGDAVAAERELAPLAEKYPNVSAVHATRGTLALLKRDQPGARRAFTRAVEIDGTNVDAVRGLVLLDVAEKKPADARQRVDALLKQNAANGAALMLAGQTYAMTGDAARAEDYLKQAIAASPDALPAYGMLGQVYASQRKLDAARTEYQKIIARQPKSVWAHTMLAMLYHMDNKLPEAEKAYEATLAVDSRAAVAANNLAWLYIESNRNLDQALQLAQAAKAALPDEPNVNDTLGWAYYKKDLYPQALEALQHSVDRDPTNVSAQYHLGLTKVRLVDLEGGRKALKEALRLNPTFDGAADAQKTLARIGG
jgi:tetratricopeptide (TPR) repeat protein